MQKASISNKPNPSKPKDDPSAMERRNSKVSILFMIFGLALVFASVFVFQTQKNQVSFSSISPKKTPSALDLARDLDLKKKLAGLDINNQRVSAELKKEQELLNLGNKALTGVPPSDDLLNGIGLSGEANVQNNNHDRSKTEHEPYADVAVPNEVAVDRAIYEKAVADQKKDREIFLERLRQRAAAQNLKLQFNSETEEVLIEREPQSDSPPVLSGRGVSH